MHRIARSAESKPPLLRNIEGDSIDPQLYADLKPGAPHVEVVASLNRVIDFESFDLVLAKVALDRTKPCFTN
jgi:hypothetical protein